MEKDRRYWILGFGAVAVALIFWLSPRPEEKKEEGNSKRAGRGIFG